MSDERRGIARYKLRNGNKMKERLLKILFDDSTVPYGVGGRSSFHRDERGGLVFSAGIVILGLAVLIGMVGNIGNEIVQKQRLQMAADAAAYSSAVWMARGMNTVCTLNHMMGELTAYIVILEAMGGPEADSRKDWIPRSECPKIEETLDTTIDVWTNTPLKEFTKSGNPIIGAIDERFFMWAKQLLVYENNEYRRCGAAILEAEITLKAKYVECLRFKCVGSACELAGNVPPLAWLKFVGWGIHGLANVQIGFIIWEGVIIKGMTFGVIAAAPIIKPIIREGLPLLSQYAEQVAGISSNTPLLKKPIEDSLQKIKSHYLLQSVEIYPGGTKTGVLPLVVDKIKATGRPAQPGFPNWGNDQKPNLIEKLLSLVETAEKITNWIGKILNYAGFILKPILKALGVSEGALKNLLNELQRAFGIKLVTVDDEGLKDNPSRKKLEEFDTSAEAESQWVRATYPYVDSMRAGIREWARDGAVWNRINISNFSTYFTNWTYRYTLNESHCIRNGKGKYRSPAHMLVLADMTPQQKGKEPWVSNAQRAEALFSVVVRVEGKKREPLFSPTLFSRNDSKGDVAYAQAMFYAGNGIDLSRSSGMVQANTGWDTLQWNYPVKAPEWKSTKPFKGPNPLLPYKFLGSIDLRDEAKASVNWQAKLVPITKARLAQIEKEQDWILKHTQLITH